MNLIMRFKMPEGKIQKLFNYLNSNTDIAVISASSKTCTPRVVKYFPERCDDIFWNKVYIIDHNDLNEIHMIKSSSLEHYVIEDTYEAPVIELRMSRDERLQSAVLAAAVEDGDLCRARKLENLYKSIETWIRLNYEVYEFKTGFNT